MKKSIFFVLFIILITIPSYSINKNNCIQHNYGTLYKEDYVQACKLISQNYIYLEKKLHKTREELMDFFK